MKKYCKKGHDRTLKNALTANFSCKQCNLNWAKVNKDKARQAVKNWNGRNREKLRGYQLKSHYGITLNEYKELLNSHNNCCAICETTKRALHVDHDHKTKRIRGILCNRCNMLLGALDNTEWRIKADIYLKERGLI